MKNQYTLGMETNIMLKSTKLECGSNLDLAVGSLLSDFDFIPDKKGFFLDVKYPGEKPRYTIDLIKWTCTCTGYTMELSRVKKDKSYKPKNCKHLEEVVFRMRNAGIKLGRFLLKEAFG